jgi:hypothetical protein
VATAQTALNLARQRQNQALAASLETNLARYQAQAASGGPQ